MLQASAPVDLVKSTIAVETYCALNQNRRSSGAQRYVFETAKLT